VPTNSSFTTARPTIVLKLGGSVLAKEADVASAVHECYRWVRAGHRVLAVVSAIGDSTDRLVAAAAGYGHAPAPSACAALIATGELTSAAHCWLGCDRAGLDAVALDPREIAFRVRGHAADAVPVSVDRAALERALDRHSVVIVPGFVGIGEDGRLALLGRGGSDLSAILLAHALGARCRLVKDVPGLYERDPARPGPFARRFATVTFDAAERLDGAILQRKALRYAIDRDFPFEVGSLGREEVTLVGAPRTAFAEDLTGRTRRVALLGFGVVGRGIWRHLQADPHRFEPVGVAVRQAKRHADAILPRLLRTDALALARDERADLVIETIGGTDLAYECVVAALSRGADVITANKTLLAKYGEELTALALLHGAALKGSAAVGGAAPLLEAIASHAQSTEATSSIARLDGILNGTTNFVLGRWAAGESFADALAEAQSLGFAETDPSADLDGHDAAEKLTLLCRQAFGRNPDQFEIVGIRACERPSDRTRLLASAWREGDRVIAAVRPTTLAEGDSLVAARDEWNRLRITLDDGSSYEVGGKGAGRWPTAEAAFADALDLWRDAQRTPVEEATCG
jgi:homoserine dehydrogenase